jgi:trans-aconitate methyltransferase
MLLQDAIDLLKNQAILSDKAQNWADLGCGSGLFTLALAYILPSESTIFAIHTNSTDLRNIPASFNHITVATLQADFINDMLSIPPLDGILMANSLHYVKEKHSFLQKLKSYLKVNHFFLIVEYNSDKASSWVPFPVSFKTLQDLFRSEGYSCVEKLNEKPSVYNASGMYSAIITT